MIACCVDAKGLDHVLTEGCDYEVERLPCGAFRVWIEDTRSIVCHGSRFEIVHL